ncbi:MAG: hypothetical protein LBV06_02380 [Propionibacteriaceae bacterium]|jgi:hypothetical protein|nr:hypothetical protein [Propionibacteriaceae bacterium]
MSNHDQRSPMGKRLTAAALILVSCATLAACTAPNHSLPSINQGGDKVGDKLVQAAQSYYDCMTAGGVKVEIQKDDAGEPTLVHFTDFKSSVQYRAPDGVGGGMYAADRAGMEPSAAEQEFANKNEPGLLVDGVDQSELYLRCLKESGYSESAVWEAHPYQADPKEVERQVKANNEWAACARAHGWPDLKDVSVPTDLSNGYSPILLPATITPEQIGQLLDVCPNWDPTRDEAMQKWWDEHPGATEIPDVAPDPAISFDFNYDSLGIGPSETPNPEQQAQLDKWSKLWDALNAKQQAYYEDKFPTSGGVDLPMSAETAK